MIKISALSLLACVVLAGCLPQPTDVHEAYATIIAEEDARGELDFRATRGLQSHENPQVRAYAVRALGRQEDPTQLPRIRESLSDPDPGVRATAVRALGQAVYRTQGDEALDALEPLLATEVEPQVLGAIAETAGWLTHDSPDDVSRAAALIASTASIDPAEADLSLQMGAARGAEALVRLNGSASPPSWSDGLLDLLGALSVQAAPNEQHRTTAARVRRLATAALGRADALGSEQVERALADDDAGVRREVVLATQRTGLAFEDVVPRALADESAQVRVEGLRAFDRWMRRAQGCDAIVDAVGDGDPHVAITAIDLLARPCRDGEAQRATLNAVLEEESGGGGSWHRGAHALVALAGLAPEPTRAAVATWSTHPSPFARAWAAAAAAESGDLASLRTLASDEVANVRTAALQGLDRLGGIDSVQDLVGQLEQDDPQLVMTAAGLLAGRDDGGDAASAMMSALARFTALGRETTRDVRTALLESAIGSGGVSAGDLEPYVSDFDPAVAAIAAAGLESLTGVAQRAAPSTLPRTPTPTAERLAVLEASDVLLEMEGGGEIRIRLRPDLAATNADRFARLAESGYFDGLTFHRVVPNFVIQGGSPNANEFAGDGPYSRDEISGAGHWRGTVGLSTRGRDTGDAQIFINLVDNSRLDFGYTIYGEVLSGMATADDALEGAVIARATMVRGTR